MNVDDARLLIQNALRAQRNVSDVAFTPVGGGVEKVSFYEDGVRGHFAVCLDEYDDNFDLLVHHVNTLAAPAVGAAKDKVALRRARLSAQEAVGVKVLQPSVG